MMMRRLHPSDEGGAVVPIVVLSLIAMFGMIVLTVDVGGILFKRRELVNGADAAALGAAQSCAKNDPGSVGGQVSGLSAANVGGAGLSSTITALVGCGANASGYVSVQLEQNKELYFAQVLGLGNSSRIEAEATAAWGPLAGGYAVPVVLDSGYLQGTCRVPDGIQINETCAFWYDNSDLGNASWGFMNLDQWNVSGSHNCSNAGASNRSDWIFNDYPDPLPLNGTPPGTSPTYVCVDTGHSSRDWMDLRDQEGKVKLFPVNDCNGQVNRSGAVAPCPATPDKYDIIGFTSLLIQHVYKGNDPAAVGTSGASGTCSQNNQDIAAGQVIDLNVFGTANGCFGSAPDNMSYANVHVFPRGAGPEFVRCLPNDFSATCAYWFDEGTRTLTWRTAAVTRARIEFAWSNDGTAGACGSRPSDPNAICLVTQWKGYTTSSGIIGDGEDFGVRGMRLCDLSISGSCP